MRDDRAIERERASSPLFESMLTAACVAAAEVRIAEGDPRSVRAWASANIKAGDAERICGRLEEAEKRLLAVIERLEASFGTSDDQLIGAMNALGVVYKYAARFVEAERLYAQALRLARARREPNRSELAALCHNLGGLEHARGRPGAGIRWARAGLELRGTELADENVEVAADFAALASLYHQAGRLDEAEAAYRRALAVFERAYGPDHYEVGVTCGGLALVLADRGDTRQAERLQRRCLQIKRTALGERHPDTALTLHNLGVQLATNGRREAALTLFRSAQATFAACYPPNHPRLLATRRALTRLTEGDKPDRDAATGAPG